MNDETGLSVERKKRLLSKTSDVQVRLLIALASDQSAGALLERFITSTQLPEELRLLLCQRTPHEGFALKNLRGWRTDERENASEELVKLEGQIQTSDDPLPFSFRLTTKFAEFENAGINYQCASQSQVPIPLFFHQPSVRDLCRAIPATLSSVSLGLERFRSRHSFSFGGAPEVSSQFHLRLNGNSLSWHWDFEFEIQSNLDATFPELRALDETFRTFGLFPSLQNEINARLGVSTHH